MVGRPCKPDADLKGLWRTLLGTPFPACGISEDSADSQAAEAIAETAGGETRGVKQSAKPADFDRG